MNVANSTGYQIHLSFSKSTGELSIREILSDASKESTGSSTEVGFQSALCKRRGQDQDLDFKKQDYQDATVRGQREVTGHLKLVAGSYNVNNFHEVLAKGGLEAFIRIAKWYTSGATIYGRPKNHHLTTNRNSTPDT